MPVLSWNKHMFVDHKAQIPNGKRLCTRTKADLLREYNYMYFDSLEQCGGGRGELSRPSEASSEQTP